MLQDHDFSCTVDLADAGTRLDQVCSLAFPQFSRARIQQWIKSGDLRVNDMVAKPKQKVVGGEYITLKAEAEEQTVWQPEQMDLNIVYEDDDILVVNKPANLVVHPAVGNWSGTLLNGLLHHCPALSNVPRAGIVHRLDKDTTGLMVVAKTLPAQTALVKQLQARTVSRHYQAITLHELPNSEFTVDMPIGRHAQVRTKMAVVNAGGKPAITHVDVLQFLKGFTHVHLQLETGRTHQIRVHLAYRGFPLVGDQVYGKKALPLSIRQANPHWAEVQRFPRQALHAWRLSLAHPITGDTLSWEAPLPEDMKQLLARLADD